MKNYEETRYIKRACPYCGSKLLINALKHISCSNYPCLYKERQTITENYQYKAKLKRVIDGDTIVFNVNLGFKIWTEVTLRLANIDTPEIRGKERELGLEARDEVVKLLNDAKEIYIFTFKQGKYGRWIGDVLFDGNNLREVLLGKGMGDELN